MLLGEFFCCVWLVLLVLNSMTTFPNRSHCSSTSAFAHLSDTSSSESARSSSSETNTAAVPNSDSASTAAAIKPDTHCHRSIDTSALIGAHCQRIASGMSVTGEINEGPGPPASCPPSCAAREKGRRETSSKRSSSSDQNSPSCYRYLSRKDCETADAADWATIRLRHCCEHTIEEILSEADKTLVDRDRCAQNVENLLELDAFVAKVVCQFEQILLRYDCQQNYSVSSCGDCKVAYRRWVCASLLPHWRERHKIKPCRSTCHVVEQNCPWLLPADITPGYPAQYAGEPIFQCIDPNIPETGEQLERSTYGSGCCYEYCEKPGKERTLNVGQYFTGGDAKNRPSNRIGSCIRGCGGDDDAISRDHSTNKKDETKVSCSSSSASANPSSTTDSLNDSPADSSSKSNVNFPLSSCSPSKISSESSASTITTT